MDENDQALVLSPQHDHYTMPASWSSNIFSPFARSTRPVCRHVFAFGARTDGIFVVSSSPRSLSPTSPSLPGSVRGWMPESSNNSTVPIRVPSPEQNPIDEAHVFAKTAPAWGDTSHSPRQSQLWLGFETEAPVRGLTRLVGHVSWRESPATSRLCSSWADIMTQLHPGTYTHDEHSV